MRRSGAAGILAGASAAAVLLAASAAGGGAAAAPDLRGLSRADARSIAGYAGWTRLLRPPRRDLASLGRAHPGVKRIHVNRSRRRLAPRGRQRFPYPVGTTIVKTASNRGAVTLIAIMRKVARSGRSDGGWDFVEYQRSSGSQPFRKVGGGEPVCTGCHSIAAGRQRSDWVFYRLR